MPIDIVDNPGIKEKRLERSTYKNQVSKKLRKAKITVEEGVSVSKIFRVFKVAVIAVAPEMIEYRSLTGQRKRSAGRKSEIK